jgi:RecB family exonuclease
MLHVTNSELQQFKRCRRAWYLKYYRTLGLRTTSPVGALQLGTRVHTCLEALYNGDDPLEVHDSLVEEAVAEVPSKETEIRKEADLSRAMLEGYIDWLEETGEDADLEIVATERVLEHEMDISGTPVTLRGKVDMVVRRGRDDGLMLFDHKTTGLGFEPLERMLRQSEQLLTYTFLQHAQDDEEKVRGVAYNVLKKSKRTARALPPFYQRFDVLYTEAEIQAFGVRLRGELEDLTHARFLLDEGHSHLEAAYPTPDTWCNWCEFKALCPLMNRQDIPEAEAEVIEHLFVEVDPNERYSEPAQMSARSSEVGTVVSDQERGV